MAVLLGDGNTPTGDGDVATATELLGDGDTPTGDGDTPTGDGDVATVPELLGDGEIIAEEGVLAVGEGLFNAVQLLSVVVEPALLSVCVLLHIVQFAQENALDEVENVPNGQLVHIRLDVLVPLVAIIWPAAQCCQLLQVNALVDVENFPSGPCARISKS